MRYPAGSRGVACAVADDFRAAARLVPEVFRYLKNDRGRAPTETRIVTNSALIGEGWVDALDRAHAHLRVRRHWNR